MLARNFCALSIRVSSRASSKLVSLPSSNAQNVEKSVKTEEFRELFVMPKRKLQAQLALERITGRGQTFNNSRLDIHDRLAVRRPRRENMKTDQDWPSVWPAAATFRASVVPLPVRMGYRRHVDRRPPFKTFGNLELMKIPNFLHLTPKHVQRHCDAIKKFCTEFPAELKACPDLVDKYLPLTIKYSDYIHQGTSLRDNRCRVNTILFKLSALKLNEHGSDKAKRLLGNRYNEATDTVSFVTDRCVTRKQNREYAEYLITAVFYESQNLEKWESLKVRTDELNLQFAGSTAEKHILEIFKNQNKLIDENSLKEFAKTWDNYRNKEETPESVRMYEKTVRNLLGIKKISEV